MLSQVVAARAGVARSGLVLAAVSGAFAASGAAALVFEALWFRQTRLAFGNSVWSSSLVLSGFMFGMALGAWLSARIGDRVRAPLSCFIALELAVAGSGIVLVHAVPWLSQLMAPLAARLEAQPAWLNLLRFSAAFVLLALPATCMGATLPLLVRSVYGSDASYGRVLGVLYGVNTLGAVLGALSVETWAIPQLGIAHSAYAAAGCNMLAVLLAGLGVLAREPVGLDALAHEPVGSGVLVSEHAAEVEPADARASARGVRWLAAAFLAGFSLLGLEVVWLRCLTLFLNDTPLAFALVLAAVLTAIALGSLAAGALSSHGSRAAQLASPCALAAGAAGVLSFRLYGHALERFYRPDQSAASVFALAAALAAPTAFASGALFSLLGAQLRDVLGLPARTAGRLLTWNLLGSALGPLAVGFVLLPWLGTELVLSCLLCLYGVTAWLARSPRGALRLQLAAAVVFVLAISAFPFGDLRERYVQASAARWIRGEGEIVGVRDGLTGTLVHIVHQQGGLPLFDQLATNAYSMTVNDFAARRYMKQFVYLPRALHPRLSRALVVGYGIGNTTAALVDDPELQSIDVVDVSRETLAMSRELRSASAGRPLEDPRVRVHIEDGRHFLAGRSAQYDLITGEPPPPIIAGVVDLYTVEYFRLVRSRLAAGGMASHWLPMMNLSEPAGRAIIAAFCVAFEDCSLWHGSGRNFMLFGTNGASGPVAAAHFRQLWDDPAQREEAVRIGFERPEQLGAAFIGDASYLAELTRGHAPLEDDRPREIQAAVDRAERDALLWQWRDTRAARNRFLSSALIAKLWPSELLARTARNFENQRLLNDLLFPEPTPARQVQVLHDVLQRTPLRLPVLLLLNSDPDIQLEMSRAPRSVLDRPELRLHRLAGLLAARDYAGALPVIRDMSDAQLPLRDLRSYVEQIAEDTPADAAAR